MYLLHRKLSRIALLEIDHSRDRVYPSVPQPRCHYLFLFSHGDRSFSLPSWRNRVVSLLDDISLSLFKCLKHYFLFSSVSSKDTQYMNINRDDHLNRCEYTFSSSFGPRTDHINSTSPSWRLLMRIKSLHTDK
jgi:hypothetical protein